MSDKEYGYVHDGRLPDDDEMPGAKVPAELTEAMTWLLACGNPHSAVLIRYMADLSRAREHYRNLCERKAIDDE